MKYKTIVIVIGILYYIGSLVLTGFLITWGFLEDIAILAVYLINIPITAIIITYLNGFFKSRIKYTAFHYINANQDHVICIKNDYDSTDGIKDIADDYYRKYGGSSMKIITDTDKANHKYILYKELVEEINESIVYKRIKRKRRKKKYLISKS